MWDERYSADEYIFGTEPNDFLGTNVGKLKPGSVLCLADGEGRNSVYLAKQGFNVTAVDMSLVGLEKARKLASDNGVEIETVHADLNDFAIEPNRWDNVVSIFCHLPESLRQKVHEASAKSLTDGGVFLLEAYTVEQLKTSGTGGPPVPELLFSAEMLKQDFQALDIVQALETEREVNEGTKHSGPAAVVQFIARKA
ncbi:Tellurite methyltransferase [Pontiella desulfatans]|uniref:Tellurite methyltransferase n=1 Tax=Pontiella desulfatans TaxID=2750659 RepID=A0A6C2UE53_PONDE|nr:class I SAM-dependent methyltransferase [Pontiella desulfatans]VGO17817.1 Tellurite methyltransferase [Pontiella desulfatans]